MLLIGFLFVCLFVVLAWFWGFSFLFFFFLWGGGGWWCVCVGGGGSLTGKLNLSNKTCNNDQCRRINDAMTYHMWTH